MIAVVSPPARVRGEGSRGGGFIGQIHLSLIAGGERDFTASSGKKSNTRPGSEREA